VYADSGPRLPGLLSAAGFRLRGSSDILLALHSTLPAHIGALRKREDLKPRF
jgi:hypothetical protein